MDLLHRQQVSFDHVYSSEPDLVIAVSGYEKRSPYLMERIKLKNETRLAIGFAEKSNETNRRENDRIFREMGFHPHIVSGEHFYH